MKAKITLLIIICLLQMNLCYVQNDDKRTTVYLNGMMIFYTMNEVEIPISNFGFTFIEFENNRDEFFDHYYFSFYRSILGAYDDGNCNNLFKRVGYIDKVFKNDSSFSIHFEGSQITKITSSGDDKLNGTLFSVKDVKGNNFKIQIYLDDNEVYNKKQRSKLIKLLNSKSAN